MKKTQWTYTIDELSEIISPILNNYGIEKAYIFGSYARGDATHQSDLDIYIPTIPARMGIKYFGMYEDIQNAVKKKIDIVTDNTAFNSDEEKEAFFKINKEKVAVI